MTKISKKQLYKILAQTDEDEIDSKELEKLLNPDLDYYSEVAEIGEATREEIKELKSSVNRFTPDELVEMSVPLNDYGMPDQKLSEKIFGWRNVTPEGIPEEEGIIPMHSFSNKYEEKPTGGGYNYFTEENYGPIVNYLKEEGLLRHKDYENVLLGKKTYRQFLTENPEIMKKRRFMTLYKNMLGYKGTHGCVSTKAKNASIKAYWDAMVENDLSDYRFVSYSGESMYLEKHNLTKDAVELQEDYLNKGVFIIDELLSFKDDSVDKKLLAIIKLFECFRKGYEITDTNSKLICESDEIHYENFNLKLNNNISLVDQATYALLRGFRRTENHNHEKISDVCKRFANSELFELMDRMYVSYIPEEMLEEYRESLELINLVIKKIKNEFYTNGISKTDKSLAWIVNPEYHRRKLAKYCSKIIEPTDSGILSENPDLRSKIYNKITLLTNLADIDWSKLEGKSVTDDCNEILEYLERLGILPWKDWM